MRNCDTRRRLGTAVVLLIGVAGCGAPVTRSTTGEMPPELAAIREVPSRRLCDEPRPGEVACHARVRVDPMGFLALSATPQGLGPAELQSAYKLDVSGGADKLIAIVDAYDSPTAEDDLATYRATFGLSACTSANGCFKKVNQAGAQGSYPKADAGWAGEIALDLAMASAVCPHCKLLLVEADSASLADLGAAVNTAVSLGATVVSNSYGGNESNANAQADANYFNHPGVALFASSGDDGYGVQYPAASPYVIGVGGTTLTKAKGNTRGWAEKVWGSATNSNGGAGSGCSSYSAKPAWQKDAGCSHRTVADVAAVADPATGVAVYDAGSWKIFGGTSAAAPIVAGIFALTGHGADSGAFSYSHPEAFFDVTAGTNGSCDGSYLCTAQVGYDGPTGNGTPNGAVLAKSAGDDGGGGPAPTPPPPAGCLHPLCATGLALGASCDPCASQICAQDSYCCAKAWDARCVSEVDSICGQRCAPAGGGGCVHPICQSGAKLSNTCDPCANQICATDSYCCSGAWDSVCVGEVKSICGQSC